MRLGQQIADLNGCEVWIAIEALAIGEGELQNLRQQVQVVGRIVAELLEIEGGQQRKCLEQDGTLAEHVARMDPPTGIVIAS